jgi:DNA repair exonuclease SbcCD ATPase subunit
MKLQTIRSSVDRELAKHAFAMETMKWETAAIAESEARIKAITEAQQAVQEIAAEIQQQAHRRIASVVTKCLQAVFEDDYELKIHFEQKRGKTEARIVFSKGGMEVDPLTASGGGVVDVAAFALRLACLTLRRPQLRRLVIADEPFRFLSAEYRPRVRVLLEQLAEELGMQFVIVTHFDDLRIGQVIEL